MPKPQSRWYYLLDREQINDTPSEAVMDMLRYDGAQVLSNGPEPGRYWFLSTDSLNGPHEDRWASFHVRVIAATKNTSETTARFELERLLQYNADIASRNRS